MKGTGAMQSRAFMVLLSWAVLTAITAQDLALFNFRGDSIISWMALGLVPVLMLPLRGPILVVTMVGCLLISSVGGLVAGYPLAVAIVQAYLAIGQVAAVLAVLRHLQDRKVAVDTLSASVIVGATALIVPLITAIWSTKLTVPGTLNFDSYLQARWVGGASGILLFVPIAFTTGAINLTAPGNRLDSTGTALLAFGALMTSALVVLGITGSDIDEVPQILLPVLACLAVSIGPAMASAVGAVAAVLITIVLVGDAWPHDYTSDGPVREFVLLQVGLVICTLTSLFAGNLFGNLAPAGVFGPRPVRRQAWPGRLDRIAGETHSPAAAGAVQAQRSPSSSARPFRPTRAELEAALEDGAFDVDYQPIVALDSRELVGVEALVRWDHPDRGRITAAAFVDQLDRTDLILPLTELVLNDALHRQREWLAQGLGELQVWVNLAPRCLESPAIVTLVSNAIARSGVSPAHLVLELTEGIFENADLAKLRLLELRRLGVGLALDDFGAGHSSLTRLKELAMDIVKIDRLLVADIVQDVRDQTILQTIVSLSGQLGLRAMVEGVETDEQLRIIRRLRCNWAQGYLIARPMRSFDLHGWWQSAMRADGPIWAGGQRATATFMDQAKAWTAHADNRELPFSSLEVQEARPAA